MIHCGSSSAGRALPCQGSCREFESRLPLFLMVLIVDIQYCRTAVYGSLFIMSF